MVFFPLSKHTSLPCLQIKTSFAKERPGEKSTLPIASGFYSWVGSISENMMAAERGSPQV